MRRTIFTTIGIILQLAFLQAQVPEVFNYQAVARDSNGDCILNENISIRISIRDSIATGPILYQEQHIGIRTNDQGLFSLLIGADRNLATGGGQTVDFTSLNWINQIRWLEIEMDTAGGTSFVQLGSQQLMSVPYALAAGNGKEYDTDSQEETLTWLGENGMKNGILGSEDTTANFGVVKLYDDSEQLKVKLGAEFRGGGSRVGFLDLFGDNDSLNITLGTNGKNNGGIALRDRNGRIRADISSEDAWAGAGQINTFGSNGNRNIALSIQSPNTPDGPNRGLIKIYDENNIAQICLRIDSAGNGVVQADIKNFIMDHPEDPSKDIVYASLEGPEAAAYERGTAKLINGQAEVHFSDHFELVANYSTMTVMLCPWSAESKGMAVIKRTASGFIVKELYDGTGNYQFDWEVKAVRKGWEDYQVIRDKVKEHDAKPTAEHKLNDE